MKYRKQLKINEIFYSIQGEGYHTGRPAVFIRFSDCNLRCDFCDTEFLSGKIMTVKEIIKKVKIYPKKAMVVLTGGEPTLYKLGKLVLALNADKKYVAIETNGLRKINLSYNDIKHSGARIEWICVSPKTDINKLQIRQMNEIKFVIAKNQLLPHNIIEIESDHYWISPMNFASKGNKLRVGLNACTKLNWKNLEYCINLVKNAGVGLWKLNIQTHKEIGVK